MRLAAFALALLVAGSAPAGTKQAPRVAFRHGKDVVVLNLVTHVQDVVLSDAGPGPVHWSGDGRSVSSGGRVVGGPRFPTGEVKWASTGETAAYETKAGAVILWSPSGGRRTVAPASWGATSFAWGPGRELAVGRSVCHAPCGLPRHQEVWVWKDGLLRRVAGPLRGVVLPRVTGFGPGGHVLWWAGLDDSGSIAADGLTLYSNRARIATTLVYPDYVVRCGSHLALAAGGDRYATHGKRILFDGRGVSRDTSRSWVSPSCSADGKTLVAAAGRNWEEPRIGRGEHRAIWQILPTRRQLTRPPEGSTDDYPHVLADGSIVFVRTRSLNTRTVLFGIGTIELLSDGRLTALGTVGRAENFYGHYDWPRLIAVAP